MSFQGFRRCCVALFAALLLVSGCTPKGTTLDEQKEPHYLRGRNRVATQDYTGAIEEFEKALQVNPTSAAAHFELAWLQEEQMKDYAAAIYHYQKHLQLKADSEYAERAKERMKACKLELARTEVLSPVTQGMQSELHRLQTENMLLKSQVEGLQAQLAARPIITNQVTIPAPQVTHAPVVPQNTDVEPATTPIPTTPRVTITPKPTPSVTVSRPRQHTVKTGETMMSISRAYNVPLAKLLNANPRIEPRQLKAGQIVKIP